jgi:SAM-dependent methyltransferase
MFSFLSQRRRQAEWMDADDVDPQELDRSLAYLRRVNSGLGYNRTTLGYLKKYSCSWRPGQRIDVLDVATGSADLPRMILHWADRNGLNVHVVGIDRHPVTARIAAQEPLPARLRIVQADVFDLPFEPNSFDYVLCAMFLHHLDDADITRALVNMNRLARRGMIIADLLRGVRASFWIYLFTLWAGRVARHDARVSIAQALNRREVLRQRERAGLDFTQLHLRFGHRFVLAGEKDDKVKG